MKTSIFWIFLLLPTLTFSHGGGGGGPGGDTGSYGTRAIHRNISKQHLDDVAAEVLDVSLILKNKKEDTRHEIWDSLIWEFKYPRNSAGKIKKMFDYALEAVEQQVTISELEVMLEDETDPKTTGKLEGKLEKAEKRRKKAAIKMGMRLEAALRSIEEDAEQKLMNWIMVTKGMHSQPDAGKRTNEEISETPGDPGGQPDTQGREDQELQKWNDGKGSPRQ